MTLTPGMRLGPYQIVALVGAGGMGEVYRARDTTLERDVALKSVDTRIAASAFIHSTPRVLFRAPIYGGGATINNWYWDTAPGGESMLFNAGSTETGASLVTVVVNWQAGSRGRAEE